MEARRPRKMIGKVARWQSKGAKGKSRARREAAKVRKNAAVLDLTHNNAHMEKHRRHTGLSLALSHDPWIFHGAPDQQLRPGLRPQQLRELEKILDHKDREATVYASHCDEKRNLYF